MNASTHSPDTPAPLVELSGVSKSYGPTRALDGLDFELEAGEVHALCGHNGAGKSSLVKVLAGLVVPDAGAIRIGGEQVEIGSPGESQRLGIAVVEQELALAETLSVADNIFLGHPRTPWLFRRQRSAAREFLKKVGLGDIPLDTPVGELRLGQRQLIEIARLLARDARILILDEPTATLSREEIDRVFAVVRELVAEGCAAIFVTHRLGEVFEFCDRVTVVRDGQTVSTTLTSAIDRRELVAMMVEGEPAEVRRAAAIDSSATPALEIRELSVPGSVHGVDLTVRPGEIVAVAGQVGAGAAELLRAVAGLDPTATGRLEVLGSRVRLGDRRRAAASGISYVSEDRAVDGLFFGRRSTENLTVTALSGLGRLGVVSASRVHQEAARLGAAAHLAPAKLRSTPETLSGGNQQKLLMGRCLMVGGRDAAVLVLSEPTRGVDIHSRHEIYEVLRTAADAGIGILVASTDLDEIFDLADTIYTMFRGRVEHRYPRARATTAAVLADMTHGTIAHTQEATA